MKIERRTKYLLLSLGTILFLFLFSYTLAIWKAISAVLTVLTALLGTALVQYSSVQTETDQKIFIKKTYVSMLILPLILVVGAILSLFYFPNLGLPTRVITIGAVGVLMYTISLVNNIFLVVLERGETIPLYRVAVTWSQILLVIISIPFFSGIFKMPINALYQSALVALTSGLLGKYLMWAQEMDPDVHEIDRGEEFVNAALVAFVVFSFSVATAFFPTESFLRSLLVSSVLMSTLGYLQAHYKNAVTKKLVAEYSVITLIFLFFVMFFN